MSYNTRTIHEMFMRYTIKHIIYVRYMSDIILYPWDTSNISKIFYNTCKKTEMSMKYTTTYNGGISIPSSFKRRNKSSWMMKFIWSKAGDSLVSTTGCSDVDTNAEKSFVD